MKRLLIAALVAALFVTGLVPATAQAQEGGVEPEAAVLQLYRVAVTSDEILEMRSAGFDLVDVRDTADGGLEVDIVMSDRQVSLLEALGKKVIPVVAAGGEQFAPEARAAGDHEVWRSWSQPGGIRDELLQLVDDNPYLLKLRTIGQSVQGEDIYAVKLTRNANYIRDGRRPATLSVSMQHAREWITVETNLRLLKYLVDEYDSNREVRSLLRSTELWFVIVANPDGYDWTFTDGNRLWRKNLADNNGDGVIDADNDGVDLNRNFSEKWGYDNEGSSPDLGSPVYRGPSPNSEPETVALDALMDDIDFEFLLNWHSAAELLLYGTGWQVATPSPDDLIMEALAGTDEVPAVEGYDPDLSAELYTTNGTTDDQAHGKYGILGYTPELDTCESAETIFDDDAFGDDYCENEGRSGFEFPDDEALIEAVFQKNLDFAMNVFRSTEDPTDPITNTGLSPATMVVDDFSVSYGEDQTVAAIAQRQLRSLRLRYSINGGSERSLPVHEWEGGETYGGDYNTYYAEYRGVIKDAQPGDTVTVRFVGRDLSVWPKNRYWGWWGFFFHYWQKQWVESESFTYTVESASDAPVLIVANEDYLGYAPEQPGVTEPLYVGAYADALQANGVEFDIWDVDALGVPHDLGVLSHYDLVVWELGDNRLTQDEEDQVTVTPFGEFADLQVAERQQDLTIAIRDFLNEGGKLFYAGEFTGYYGFFGDALGGAYYGLNGDETADCEVADDFFGDCLIFSDDFAQYYLGIWSRQPFEVPGAVQGISGPFDGAYQIDGSLTPESGAFTITSELLDPAEFPQFESSSGAQYEFTGPSAFEPFSGDQYVAALHADDHWMRLSQTVDLTAATTAAELALKMSYNLEGGYDHVIIEARTAGGNDWTTLPDLNGATSQVTPSECEAGFFADIHPDLTNYFTLGDPCTPAGATGEWHSFTGVSGGWTDVAVDLSAWIGSEVEVSVSYVTDPGSGGIGVFVDDVVVTIDGASGPVNDFEGGLGDFSVPGPPVTSPGNSASDWIVSPALFDPPAAVALTDDTVTFGYGFEALATEAERAAAMAEVLAYLLPDN